MNIFAKISKFKDKYKKIISNKILVVLALIFVIVILFFSFKTPKSEGGKQNEIQADLVSNYSVSVENKLESMLNKIDEINSVSVFVALESTPKIEYLTETEETINSSEKNSTSTKSTTVVFEKNGSVHTPVVVTTIMPKVIGVLIVTNKISASTKHAIINSVSVVLNIDALSISILQES